MGIQWGHSDDTVRIQWEQMLDAVETVLPPSSSCFSLFAFIIFLLLFFPPPPNLLYPSSLAYFGSPEIISVFSPGLKYFWIHRFHHITGPIPNPPNDCALVCLGGLGATIFMYPKFNDHLKCSFIAASSLSHELNFT